MNPQLLLLTLLPASLWGLNNVAIAAGLEQLPAAGFTLARTGLGAIGLLACLQLMGTLRRAALTFPQAAGWVLLGTLGLGLFQLFMTLSIRENGPAIMGVLSTLSQLLAMAHEKIAARTRPGWAELGGSAVALLGVVVIYAPALAVHGAWHWSAVLYGLAAPVCWAAFSIGTRRVAQGVDPLVATTLTLCGAVLALAPAAAIEWANGRVIAPAQLTVRSWLALSVGTVVGSIAANIVWIRVVRRIGAAQALLATYLLPVVTVVLAWLLLGEGLDSYELVGGLLVLAGVAWVRPPQVAQRSEPATRGSGPAT